MLKAAIKSDITVQRYKQKIYSGDFLQQLHILYFIFMMFSFEHNVEHNGVVCLSPNDDVYYVFLK